MAESAGQSSAGTANVVESGEGQARGNVFNRSEINVGAWNVGTLKGGNDDIGRLRVIIRKLQDKNVQWDIIGLSETHKIGFGNTEIDGHHFYWSGHTIARKAGVGFLVHKDCLQYVIPPRDFDPQHEDSRARLMTIRLRAQQKNITLVQVYIPYSEGRENCFKDLQNVLDKHVPTEDILIVGGNWTGAASTASAEPGLCGTNCYRKKNVNSKGKQLLEFARRNKLALTNTFGDHTRKDLWTFKRGNQRFSQIDYILVHSCYLERAETKVIPDVNIGSKHRLLKMTFQLHLRPEEDVSTEMEKLRLNND